MNKKRGFTLIEIIICIALIAIIGTAMTFVVIKSNKNKQIKTLENNKKILENALEVYLENHEEVQNNLENNAKGAIVTLEVLKNEGLIDEKQLKGIKLKKNYFFLSYSMLDTKENTDCDNNVIPLSIVESWNVDTDKVVYICPRTDSGTSDTNKSSVINQYGNSGYYIAKGSNPNNWVKFEVTAGNSNTDLAYFPNDEDKDLWRIISIDENGGIKLVYNKDVKANNQLIYTNYNENDKNYEKSEGSETNVKSTFGLNDFCDSDYSKCFYQYKYVRMNRNYTYFYFWYAFYKLNTPYNYVFGNEYCEEYNKEKPCRYNDPTTVYRYSELNGWNIMDLYDDAIYNNDDYKENTKLYYLYNNIKNRNWLDNVDTYLYYNQSGSIYEIDFSQTKKSKFSTITSDDVKGSILTGKSWLYDYVTISGVSKQNLVNGNIICKLITLRGGSTDANYNILQNPTECSKSDCYSSNKQAFTINTSSYYPVIVLKSNVKLKENKCNTKDKLGSKNCPYTLEWVDDVTDGTE